MPTMTDYFVELNPGQDREILADTNFGFSFSLSLVTVSTITGSMAELKDCGVLTVASICHQVEMVPPSNNEIYGWDAEEAEVYENGYTCSICSEISEYPKELIQLSEEQSHDSLFASLVSLTTFAGLDTLDSTLVVDRLLDLINELWSLLIKKESAEAITARYPGKLEL